MFLHGLMAVVLTLFLPGYIAVKLIRFPGDAIRTLNLAFGVSLVVNHALVVALTATHCFTSGVLHVVAVAEAIAALGLWLRSRGDCTSPLETRTTRLAPSAFYGIVAICCTALGWIGYAVFRDYPIFNQWDAIVSWNRWALDWADGRFPRNTMQYPQLLPTSWSLTYVFLNDPGIWFFAKAMMPLFVLWFLLLAWDATRETGDAAYAWGGVVSYGLFVLVLRARLLGSGHADLPVACFGFATFYALVLADRQPTARLRLKYVLWGAVAAAGAALTKQGGWYVVAIYPMATWLLLHSGAASDHHERAGGRRLAALVGGATAVFLAAPWYVFVWQSVSRGHDSSIVYYLVKLAQQDRTTLEQLVYAATMIKDTLTVSVTVLVLIGSAWALLNHRPARIGLLLVAGPYTLVWSLAFSYDARNWAMALPFFGLAIGAGAARWAERLPDLRRWIGERWVPTTKGYRLLHGIVATTFGLTIVGLSFILSDDLLRDKHLRLQKQMCDPRLNAAMYEYAERRGLHGVIASNYLPLAYLPELNRRYRPFNAELDRYLNDPEVELLVLLNRPDEPIHDQLQRAISVGDCEAVYRGPVFNVYRNAAANPPIR